MASVISSPHRLTARRAELAKAAARVRELAEQSQIMVEVLASGSCPQRHALTSSIERLADLASTGLAELDSHLAAVASGELLADSDHRRLDEAIVRLHRLVDAASVAYTVACVTPPEAGSDRS